MEKYSTWRDKGTGISPFLPSQTPQSPFSRYIANPLKLALKWPCFIVLYVLALVVPKQAAKAILSLLFSVSDIDLSVEGIRKSKKEEIYSKQPGVGDVVISNLVSPLDIVVQFVISKVSSVSSIAVLFPVGADLHLLTFWQALYLCFVSVDGVSALGVKVTDLKAQVQGKLVIFFAEGTATNNKAVMPPSPLISKVLELSPSVKVSVLRYYPGTVTVPVPYLSPKAYVSKLLAGAGKTYVKVKIVPLEEQSPKSCQRAFTENGLSQVDFSLREKEEFFAYFQDYSLGKITKK